MVRFNHFAIAGILLLLAGYANARTIPPLGMGSQSAQPVQGTQLNQSDKLIPTRRSRPHFPAAVVFHPTQGCVTTVFDVNPAGHPVHIGVLMSVPGKAFDKAATSAIRHWQFRSSKNGNPAWTYNVVQRINFLITGKSRRGHQELSWLCNQPSSKPVLVSPALTAFSGQAVIATYGEEAIAYLPAGSRGTLQPGYAKVRFCVDKRGNIVNSRVLRATRDPRYGPLAIAVLQARSFTPFEPEGTPQKVCDLTWPLNFVTTPPPIRPPVASTSCSCSGSSALKIVTLRASLLAPGTRHTPAPDFVLTPQGKAGVKLCINADGSAAKPMIAHSSGNTLFDRLALHIISNFRFFAQRNDAGQPVASCGWRTAVRFESAQNAEITSPPGKKN